MTTQQPVPETGLVPQAGAGTVVRAEFGALERSNSGELNAQRAGAEAQALVQARYVMALQRPRDWDNVRVRLMREVERPGFAEVAWFKKPVGKGVEGLSVRFAEAAARCMGNLLIDPQVTYEDAERRVVKVTATDLEANLTVSLDVTVEKTVERLSLGDGRVALSMRKNSRNEVTYTVRATEDELLGKTNSYVSKARRNLVLQILPGDIADAAKVRILAIRRGEIAKDPEAAKRKVVDSFAALNILPSELKRFLGHDVAQCTPAEIEDLRELYAHIQNGDTTMQDAIAERHGEAAAAEPPAPPKPGLAGVTEKLQPPTTTDPVGKVVEAVRSGDPQAAAAAAVNFVASGGAPPSDASTCTHPNVPTSIPKGTTVVCEICGEELGEDPPEAPPALDPARDPAVPPAAPARGQGAATKGKGGQQRLREE